jgi:hypothetical protein
MKSLVAIVGSGQGTLDDADIAAATLQLESTLSFALASGAHTVERVKADAQSASNHEFLIIDWAFKLGVLVAKLADRVLTEAECSMELEERLLSLGRVH